MKYILHQSIALRSWPGIPYSYLQSGRRHVMPITKEEFTFLAQCNGATSLTDGILAHKFLNNRVIIPAETDCRLENWQLPRSYTNHYFPSVNWAVTGRCNFNCRHCFMAKDKQKMTPEFTYDECIQLLQQFEECGIHNICLTGGEPFLRGDLKELLTEIARRRFYLVDIGTNGSLISQDILDVMRQLGQAPLFKVSFDGLGHHDWIRGVDGAEELALHTVRLLKANGFPVKIQTCLHKGNLHTLYDTTMAMAELSVDEIRIIRTAEAPRWAKNNAEYNLSAEEYFDAALDFLKRYIQSGAQMRVTIWGLACFDPREKCIYFRNHDISDSWMHEFRDTVCVCPLNREMLFIGCDGALAPCNQLSGVMRSFGNDWGNVLRDGLTALLTDSEYLTRVTCTIGKLFENNSECGSCEFRYECQAGCRAVGYGITGDYYGKDYMGCVLYKKGYQEKLRLLCAEQHCTLKEKYQYKKVMGG